MMPQSLLSLGIIKGNHLDELKARCQKQLRMGKYTNKMCYDLLDDIIAHPLQAYPKFSCTMHVSTSTRRVTFPG